MLTQLHILSEPNDCSNWFVNQEIGLGFFLLACNQELPASWRNKILRIKLFRRQFDPTWTTWTSTCSSRTRGQNPLDWKGSEYQKYVSAIPSPNYWHGCPEKFTNLLLTVRKKTENLWHEIVNLCSNKCSLILQKFML